MYGARLLFLFLQEQIKDIIIIISLTRSNTHIAELKNNTLKILCNHRTQSDAKSDAKKQITC
jgi:hypothetical protein